MRMKRLIRISLSVLLPLSILLMGAAAGRQHGQRHCTGVDIRIIYDDAQPMLTREMILQVIGNVYDMLPGRPLADIEADWITEELEGMPMVADASLSIEPAGRISIRVWQRKPLLRVVFPAHPPMVFAEDGMIMPSVTDMALELPVFSSDRPAPWPQGTQLIGLHADEVEGSELPARVHRLGLELSDRPFMYDMVEQVYLSGPDRLLLVPMLGPDRVLFGSFDDARTKLRNLEAFYRKTSGHIDWSRYRSIDARFTNQIVCIKAN